MSGPNMASSPSARVRLRDLVPGLQVGAWPTGPKNGITDVSGVLVHTKSIHSSDGSVNTGLTTIIPRKEWFNKACYAGVFRYNGSGELSGSHWIEETGLLHSPIVLTNSFAVGNCCTGIYQYAIEKYSEADGGVDWFLMPVVGETYDGYLNDLTQFVVTPQHVVDGIKAASADPVPEGNTGGGTGMLCQGFKGGTGTSSRVVPGFDSKGNEKSYTIAALVQANYGRMQHLHITGIPVGRILAAEAEKSKEAAKAKAEYDAAKDKRDGSIIIVLATDAPLSPIQLQRLAKRASGGLSRVGGYGHNTSGDIFIAFSTANEIPVQTIGVDHRYVDPFKANPLVTETIDDTTINALLEAAADSTEEAIYNTLCMAKSITGYKGNHMDALPLDKVKGILEKHIALEKAIQAEL
ncbi:peptidase family s58 [Trichoderma arundinaceum]|uniref:Peptidase family s58 n=1 Tax=Trichoderma arundinaceum TaxID=490622 RepID=A0A395P016_TRIAR|nr:peptidase family s58 [Trichoderma arundinaceum]